MMDEISTGLDSSTTFQITQILAHFTHIREATLLVALLQPAPEVYDQFDDILLLSEGTIVYHGPREEVPTLDMPPWYLVTMLKAYLVLLHSHHNPVASDLQLCASVMNIPANDISAGLVAT
jgi:ABC-type Mn2+/Zn2+ transport system ATPase subunit